MSLIEGADTPTLANQVEVGAVIKWIYIEFNLNGVDNSGTVQVFHWMIFKNPSNIYSGAFIDPATYNQTQRKFILKRGMEMLPEIPLGSGGTVQTKRIFVLKLPPRLRRFGENDRLQLHYKSTSASGVNFCGIFIYKENK